MNERFKNIKGISDIVDAMIKGLRKEWVHVHMGSYGGYRIDRVTCFGCAATNTLCEIMQEAFTPENIVGTKARSEKFNFGVSANDLRIFEEGIDLLRRADIEGFFACLSDISYLFGFQFPVLDEIVSDFALPYLSNGNWKEGISGYEKYRDWLRERGL